MNAAAASADATGDLGPEASNGLSAYANFSREIEQSQLRYIRATRGAYQDYLGTLQNAAHKAQENLSDAYKNLASVARESGKSSTEAYKSYSQGVQHTSETTTPEDAYLNYVSLVRDVQKQNAEAYRAYLLAFDELSGTGLDLSDVAQRKFSETLAEVHNDMANEQRDALRSYIQMLKDSWVTLDVDKATNAYFSAVMPARL
jgi:tetratricopeptide (TPR) repeat protein